MLPSLERITPRVSFGVLTNPSTSTAVKVEVIARGVDDFETFLGDGGDVGGGDPYPIQIEVSPNLGNI